MFKTTFKMCDVNCFLDHLYLNTLAHATLQIAVVYTFSHLGNLNQKLMTYLAHTG